MNHEAVLTAIENRELTVGVVGLGYVGLPLVVGFAEVGFKTVGFDIDAERIAQLNAGFSHIEDIASERVAAQVDASRFKATTEPAVLGECDAVFIAVPTPFDEAKTPDLSYVESATAVVGSILRPGMLVILQSTTWPGTTTEFVLPRLEDASGLTAGTDFALAFSPERVDPGNVTWTLRNTPKLVGGVSPACAQQAAGLLSAAMDEDGLVKIVSSPASAEMAKLLENTYRAVNIALVNELAQLAHRMGVDLWEVIDGAATKPFGFQAFYPGIGPGGHCIPVDPYYLSWQARKYDFQTKFIDMAADTNLAMADYVVGRLTAILNANGRAIHGSKILVYGVSFKAGVSDIRNSRALHLVDLLHRNGADVSYHDPYVPSITLADETHLKSVDLTEEALDGADLVAIFVGHQELPADLLRSTETAVFDAVNSLQTPTSGTIERL